MSEGLNVQIGGFLYIGCYNDSLDIQG